MSESEVPLDARESPPPAIPLGSTADHAQSRAEQVAEDIIVQIMLEVQGEVSSEVALDTPGLDLPDDLQDPSELRSQADFWAAV